MKFTWDTITFINLILCILILIFGIISYLRKKSRVALYVGTAFGAFAITHLMKLFNMSVTPWDVVQIVIRILAYLLVTYAMFVAAYSKEKKKK